MQYTIKRLPAGTGAYEFSEAFDPKKLKSPWNALDEAEILDYPWLSLYPDHFFAAARVGLSDRGINVLMYAKEAPVRAKETKFGGMPCEDSCLEFFLCPFPEDGDKYFNIEINPIGTAHVGVGEGRHGRRVYDKPIEGLQINTCVSGAFWAVSFVIPNSLFVENFGKTPTSGAEMKGNFFKCSGHELHEHYGCWNHVGTERPDYHRPEYFAPIAVE